MHSAITTVGKNEHDDECDSKADREINSFWSKHKTLICGYKFTHSSTNVECVTGDWQ